jgi:CrcB protein
MPQRIDQPVLGYVVVGGALGVLARAAITGPLADSDAALWATFGINVAGSLLLGVVIGALGERRPHLRAFLGTGILGGFTTYSAFAVETTLWLAQPWLAGALVAASLAGGVAGAVAGLFLGRRVAGRRGGIEAPEDAE